jgi:hypothetical protein
MRKDPFDATTSVTLQKPLYVGDIVESCTDYDIEEVVDKNSNDAIKWVHIACPNEYWLPVDNIQIVPVATQEAMCAVTASDDIETPKSSNTPDDTSNTDLHDDDTNIIQSSFRVISCGKHSSTKNDTIHHQSSKYLEPGFYYSLPGYEMKIWKSYNNLHVATNAWHLCVIDRTTLQIDYAFCYTCIDSEMNIVDTQGRRIRHLVHDLNELNDTKIIVIFTTGSPGSSLSCRLSLGLPEALMRCGASNKIVNTLNGIGIHDAYVLIGIPGIGEGSGHEIHQRGEDDANIDVTFDVDNNNDTGAGWNIVGVTQGVQSTIHHYCGMSFDSSSYLFSVLQSRTDKENTRWIEKQKHNMPSILKLYQLEAAEIGIPLLGEFIAFTGLGHIITKTGRLAWKIII